MPRIPNPYIEDLIQADPEKWRDLYHKLRADQSADMAEAQSLRSQEAAIRWRPDIAPPSKPGLALTEGERAAMAAQRVKRSERLNHATHGERMELRVMRTDGRAARRLRHLVLSMFRGRTYRRCERKAIIPPYATALKLGAIGIPSDLALVICERFKTWTEEVPAAIMISVPMPELATVAA